MPPKSSLRTFPLDRNKHLLGRRPRLPKGNMCGVVETPNTAISLLETDDFEQSVPDGDTNKYSTERNRAGGEIPYLT
jgi:hypothetical protein